MEIDTYIHAQVKRTICQHVLDNYIQQCSLRLMRLSYSYFAAHSLQEILEISANRYKVLPPIWTPRKKIDANHQVKAN